jgi:Fe-S-cluster containining protein
VEEVRRLSRIALPVLRDERPLVECTTCGRCCTYVGIGINAPSRPRQATDILWYLYHENVYVYVDGAGEWSVHFEARCKNLGEGFLCGVYARRPHICRGFDNRSCEVNDPGHGSLTFREPREFLAWLRAEKPRVYAQIEAEYLPEALRLAPLRGAQEARSARVATGSGQTRRRSRR